MRSLRERLNAVASAPRKSQMREQKQDAPFFCRESVVPLDQLKGIEYTTLQEIRSCDPTFSADSWDVNRLLFLDTETTGLNGGAGTVAFEIGLGWIERRGMVIRQYVMRDYHEEAAMLEEIAGLFRRFDTVVSFNGKSFDLPLLESRMTMNRIRLPVTSWAHFDLLHAARRVYKLRLGRCNLSRLEAVVFAREREDDLPGAQVPQRYFDYLKTKEFALLEDVLAHNMQDVRSLAELTGHLCAVFRNPGMLSHQEDVFCVGKTLLRTGNKDKGRNCLRIISCSTLSAQAHMHLSLSYKKEKDWQQACASWDDMISRAEGGVFPYVEAAKYHEHISKNYEMALDYAMRALSYTLNQSLLTDDKRDETEKLMKRIARLKAKIGRDLKKRGI